MASDCRLTPGASVATQYRDRPLLERAPTNNLSALRTSCTNHAVPLRVSPSQVTSGSEYQLPQELLTARVAA